jgi:hypothetical protein
MRIRRNKKRKEWSGLTLFRDMITLIRFSLYITVPGCALITVPLFWTQIVLIRPCVV